ncbi:MAG TPA: protoporphyrinogen oxidase [Terriglobales bacterium]|nr:protoporphyrinogen oxidase [Terriglobales bacterium]
MSKRIAIIGGGISGLSAAYALEGRRMRGVPVEYVLFEATQRLGGVLMTERVQACLVEAGPDSFLTEKPWAIELCKKLDLADQLVGSNDSDRKTYIVVKNKLVVMPDGLMFMVPTKILPTMFSPLFSLRTKVKMAAEWFHPPRKACEDETVADMVARHYGPEMVDRLADPLLSGVYGGEASQLSARAVMSRFSEMEAKHGSLGRAVLAARKKMAATPSRPAPPLFTSLKEGMQQMVNALVKRLDRRALRTSAPVQSVMMEDGGFTVSAGYNSDHFDAVILATPAPSAATMLRLTNERLASELAAIRYSSSITVTLGYDEDVCRSLPPGFGFLVPRSEGRRMLAATFVHNKFPGRAPENRAIVRCFLGGARDEAILSNKEDEILRIVRVELKEILGLAAEPLFTRVYKWRNTMAQYEVGHLERIQRIQSLCEGIPGFVLAGNAFTGIGVPDCVRSGMQAADQLSSVFGLGSADPAQSAGD